MQHLLLKAATTTATDEGTFTAVISAASIDREKDIVDPAGMVRALQKWTSTGKNIPLAWNHSTKAEDQIGYVDPASAKAVDGEVVVNGWIDQSTAVGADAWRLVKAGTLGFSFGYLIPDGGATKRAGGGNHIHELDVFEITASPTPMNNDTRVLGWKAAVDQPPTPAQLRILNSMIGQAQEYIAAEAEAEDAVEMAEILVSLEELRGEPDTEDEGDGMMGDDEKSVSELTPKDAEATGKEPPKARSVDPLREKADAVALEFLSGGESLRKSPAPKKPAAPPDLIPLKELRRRSREEMLTALSGGPHE